MLEGKMMHRELSIIEILRHAADAFPETEVVSRQFDGSLHRYGYHDAYRRASQLAHALSDLGVRQGDRIATMAWNNHRHFELYYGTSGTGAVCHTLNPRLFRKQLCYIANNADDSAIFVDADLVPVAESVVAECKGIDRTIILCCRTDMPRTSLPGAICYEELIEGRPPDFDWPDLDENSAAAMCYTSGTTGDPKGVLYSHRTTVLHALGLISSCIVPYGTGCTVMPIVPMFHVQAWGQPYVAPIAGSKLVLPGSRLDGKSLHDIIEAEGVTVALGVPTIWLGLLEFLRASGTRRTSLKHLVTGGAAAPASLIKALEEEYGINVVQGWGMTETSPVCAGGASGRELDRAEGDSRYQLKLGQRRFFGVEFRLRDDSGDEVPAGSGHSGELQCRGHWIANGYYNNDHGSSEVMTADGWFRTGDVATIDRGGLMRVTDREKDLIKSGGEWISSIDLENQVMSHPDVAEAAAISAPHPKWQERPVVVVVARAGRELTADEIRIYLEDRIASWWMPDEIHLVKELPHTATGKVSKLTLRELHRRGELD